MTPNTVLGDRFILQRPIAKGGSSVVWQAEDRLSIGRQVALKVLSSSYRTHPRGRERLLRELNLLESLHHPNLAQFLGAWPEADPPYFSFELLEGKTLKEILWERASARMLLDPTEILNIFEPICLAVQHAHERGAVHRDLKPSNVMICQPTGLVKVLDFGIGKILDESPDLATTQGRIMGTVMYMSPEQAKGEVIDARTDIFALGILLFELATLRRAWAKNSHGQAALFAETIKPVGLNAPMAVLERMQRPPKITDFRPEFEPSIDLVLRRAMAFETAERLTTVEGLLAAVARALEGTVSDDAWVDGPTELANTQAQVTWDSLVSTLRPTIEEEEITAAKANDELPETKRVRSIPDLPSLSLMSSPSLADLLLRAPVDDGKDEHSMPGAPAIRVDVTASKPGLDVTPSMSQPIPSRRVSRFATIVAALVVINTCLIAYVAWRVWGR